jgi:hypothetical protein
MENRRKIPLIFAAVCFGYGYLVNPLIGLFPPLIALLVWRAIGPKASLLFLGLSIIPIVAFGMRNANLDAHSGDDRHIGRAAINLVQGSWPVYHHAWQALVQGDPGGTEIIRLIGNESRLLDADPISGASAMINRMRMAPGYYATWYLWNKPALLWSWDIQIGPGGVYSLNVKKSPLKTVPLLHASSKALQVANPLLTLLAFSGAFTLLIGGFRGSVNAGSFVTALLMLYLTLVHTVFQAEPRYANAYRGVEVLVILSALRLALTLRDKKGVYPDCS